MRVGVGVKWQQYLDIGSYVELLYGSNESKPSVTSMVWNAPWWAFSEQQI